MPKESATCVLGVCPGTLLTGYKGWGYDHIFSFGSDAGDSASLETRGYSQGLSASLVLGVMPRDSPNPGTGGGVTPRVSVSCRLYASLGTKMSAQGFLANLDTGVMPRDYLSL